MEKRKLSWSAVTGAETYQVYKHTSNDSSSAGQSGPSLQRETTSYTDTSAGADAAYYWLKACDANNHCSEFSNVAHLGVTPPTAAPVLQGVIVGSIVGVTADLSWGLVERADYYELYDQTNDLLGDEPLTATVVTALSIPYTPEPEERHAEILEPVTNHSLWLKACNSVGCSDFSDVLKLISVPQAPKIWTQAKPDINNIGILLVDGTWDAVPGATSYQVYKADVNNSSASIPVGKPITETPGLNEFIRFGSVPQGDTSYFWLKACNAADRCADYSNVGKVVGVDRSTPILQGSASTLAIDLFWYISKTLYKSDYSLYRSRQANGFNDKKLIAKIKNRE